MKIALFSGASSVHTVRWANGLSNAGHEVHVITQHAPCEEFLPEVKVHLFPNRGIIGYFLIVPEVRKLLKKLQPDILNAHFASGYATTARLVNIRPFVLSVWGSDIYDFPNKSLVHEWFVRKNLMSADTVASTSYAMAEEIRKVAPELSEIKITPFGVNMKDFSIVPTPSSDNQHLTIGTVKTMEFIYGIDTLIEAFYLLYQKLCIKKPEMAERIRLRLVGDGSQINRLKQLAERLGVSSKVDFIGRVPHSEVPNELSKLDIYVALSRIESFGVAIIEAGAACRPVVVSDVGGLPEVTLDKKTGLIVPVDDPQAAADALEQLVLSPELRIKMGEEARKHVANSYSWDVSIDTMLNVYKETIANHKK